MSRWVVRVLAALATTTAVGGACTPLQRSENVPYRPPGVNTPVTTADAGRVLYDRDCAWCHGSRGEGTRFGPDLDGPLDGGAYTHFMLETGRMPLEGPRVEASRGSPRYTAPEIDGIVAYVKTFGGTGPDVPALDVGAGDLSRGAEIYLDDCAACHASTGAGGALTSGQVVPDLQPASDLVVAEAVLVGPGCPNTSRTCGPGEGAMPRFQLDQGDLDSLVRYVAYLHRPEDAGGAPIGRIGPVAEGAVALGVGLVVLLIVARWIGTRSGERG